ncbi:ATPase morc2 [Ranunculus cassubicifolius]
MNSSSKSTVNPNNNNNKNQTTTLEFRSFWKAGGYVDDDDAFAKSIDQQGELEHARVHPKFLHSNATSHKWAFGAIAELLDNAVDEIGKGATFLKLDKISNPRDHSPALLFLDDGGGMDPASMRQCMSLGYSNKKETAIGQYGNGFKTSTMRLGADVIVFSRTTRGSHTTQSIGLLSYTFLRKTGQDDVIVPMIDFELFGDRKQPVLFSSQEDWSNNLGIILEWSPFSSESELMQQFKDIGPHGTKIIVYNLWLNDDGLLELDFDCDEEDIRLRDEINREKSLKKFEELIESHISYHIRFSLKAYISILYLRKFENFDVILRGKPVQHYNIVDGLKFTEVVMYRPQIGNATKEVSVRTEIGFVKEAPHLHVSGFNVYHKNRLIRPFWKVNKDGSSRGNGVVGILEANFIEPAHDKQDFERSALFLKLEAKLKQMNLDYWKTHGHLIGLYSGTTVAYSLQKEHATRPNKDNAANLQRELEPDQSIIGLAANAQHEAHINEAVVGLAANINLSHGQTDMHRDLSSSSQPIISIALIETLERDLAETKKKCSELSSSLESRRKKN